MSGGAFIMNKRLQVLEHILFKFEPGHSISY